ncbi:hypothetical protein TNCV_2237451 [Trichonephila clavipes]|nr:hypothetical protein TNCV_2237451 [Trichonephila clavipes]
MSYPRHYQLQSSSLQHSHTSANGAAIAGNSSGRRPLEALQKIPCVCLNLFTEVQWVPFKQVLTVENKRKPHGAKSGE